MKPRDCTISAMGIGILTILIGFLLEAYAEFNDTVYLFGDVWIICGIIIIAISIAIHGLLLQLQGNSTPQPLQYCLQCGKVLVPSEVVCTRCGKVRSYK